MKRRHHTMLYVKLAYITLESYDFGFSIAEVYLQSIGENSLNWTSKYFIVNTFKVLRPTIIEPDVIFLDLIIQNVGE